MSDKLIFGSAEEQHERMEDMIDSLDPSRASGIDRLPSPFWNLKADTRETVSCGAGLMDVLLTKADGRTFKGIAYWSNRTIPGRWVYPEWWGD